MASMMLRAVCVGLGTLLSWSAGAQVSSGPGPKEPPGPEIQAVTTYSIGAGVEGLSDWSRSMVFVDLIKQARAFGTANAPWDEQAPVDADGWPTTDFGVVLFTGMKGIRGTGGVYRLSCDCAALPEIKLPSSTARLMNVARDAASGRVTADIMCPDGIEELFVAFRNTSGGVRNLRVLRPGYSPEDVFTRPFLDHMARFSTIRFMTWTRTNGSPVKEWSDRTRPGHARYTVPGGVPWEVCAQLCNRLRADMWINVPHMASDDYVQQLAALLNSALDKERNLYVEYSNEVWNFGFTQATWNKNAAAAEVQAGDSVLSFDSETNQYYWGWRRVAKRTKEIADIFRPVLGARLRPVLAGQMGNAEVLAQGLRMSQAAFGPPRNYLYALAGAPYFNLGSADQKTDLTVDQVLDALEASVAKVPKDYHYEKHIAMARWHGLEFMAYEGGPDTFGANNVEAKRAASLHPRMREICEKFLNGWFDTGFGEFLWYVAGATNWGTPYGTWGLTYDMSVQSTPKIAAIDGVRRAARTPPTAGTAAPGDVDARHFIGAPDDWATRDPYLRTPSANTSKDYLVRVEKAGSYEVSVEIAAGESAGTLHLLVNSRPQGIITVQPTGGWERWGRTHPVNVELAEGLSVVRLTFVTDRSCNVKNLVFSAR